MRYIRLALTVLSLAASAGGRTAAALADSRQPVVVFVQTDGSMWQAVVGETGLVNTTALDRRLWTRRADLAVSPDGRSLAYTKSVRRARTAPGGRTVEIVDLHTAVTRPLSNFTASTVFGPSWSPDGNRLAINVFDGQKWGIGIVDSATMQVRPLARGQGEPECLTPAWAPSGEWLCCLGLGTLSKLRTVDGRAETVFSVKKALPETGASMPSRCSVSRDGRNVLFETEIPDPEVSWHEGARPVAYAISNFQGTPLRAGPPDYAIWKPTFVDEKRFVFLGLPLTPDVRAKIARNAVPPRNLYMSSLADTRAVLLRAAVADFTASYTVTSNKPSQSDGASPGR